MSFLNDFFSNTRAHSTKPVNTSKFIQGKHFFLTWPHCSNSAVSVLTDLVDSELDIYDVQVVPEAVYNPQTQITHNHLHAYIAFNKRKKLSFKHFDYVTGKHPNLLTVRNKKAVFTYMLKQNIPVGKKDIWELALKSDFYATSQRMLRLNFSPSQIFQKYSHVIADKPLNFLDNFKYKLECTAHKIQQQKKHGIELIPTSRAELQKYLNTVQLALLFPSPSNKYAMKSNYRKLIDYINDICVYKHHRPHKSLVLCITAPSNFGKGTLLLELRKHISSWKYPTDGWFNGYQDNLFWLIHFNEWKLPENYENFLEFLEGQIINLPIKGSKTLKTDNPSIILTSQRSLAQQIAIKFPVRKVLTSVNDEYANNYGTKRTSYEDSPQDLTVRSQVTQELTHRIQEIIFSGTDVLFPIVKLIRPLK